jgi:hypothetical protein
MGNGKGEFRLVYRHFERHMTHHCDIVETGCLPRRPCPPFLDYLSRNSLCFRAASIRRRVDVCSFTIALRHLA